MKNKLILILFLLAIQKAHAVFTEVGVSYSKKRTSFDTNNYTDSESTTGSISFYFLEKVALELSYTDGTSIREEKIADIKYTTQQKTKVLGADLIFVFADRKAPFQPYLKGGAAQLTRLQIIKVDSLSSATEERLDPDVAVVPSYGAGLKVALTDSFGIKLSYDAWKTPLGNSQTSDDSQIRAGISWIF